MQDKNEEGIKKKFFHGSTICLLYAFLALYEMSSRTSRSEAMKDKWSLFRDPERIRVEKRL